MAKTLLEQAYASGNNYVKQQAALAKQYEQEKEDEAKRQAEIESNRLLNEGIQSGALKDDGSEKSFGDKFAETASKAPGAIWESLTSSYKRIGEGNAEVLNEITGGAQKERDQQAATQAADVKTIKALGEKIKAATSEEEKDKYRKALKVVSDSGNESDAKFQERQSQVAERTDSAKAAGAIGSIGLDIVTGGAVKAVAAGAKGAKVASSANKVINTANKVINPTGIKQAIGSGAALGTAYGITGTLEDQGKDAGLGDYVGSALTGAALGGVLGGVGGAVIGGISKGISKLRNAKNPGDIAKVTDELVAEVKTTEEAKRLELAPGYRATADIEADIAKVQAGEDPELYRYTTTEGQDVTEQMAVIDKEIAARQTAIRDLEQQAAGIDNNTGKTDIPEGVDPSTYEGDALARGNAEIAVTKLTDEVEQLKKQQEQAFNDLGGVEKTRDVEATKARFSQLQEEYGTAKSYEDNVRSSVNRQDREAIDVAKLDAEEAAIRSGNIDKDMYLPFKPTQTVDEAVQLMEKVDPDDANGVLTGAGEVQIERFNLNTQREELYSPEKYDAEVSQLNQQYKLEKQAIEALPEPVQVQRMADLDEGILAKYDSLDEKLATDAPDLEEVDMRLGQLDELETALVTRVNEIEGANPVAFRQVDEAAVEGRLTAIKAQKFLALEGADANQSKSILADVRKNGGSIAEEAQVNEAVAKAVDEQITDKAPAVMDNTGKTAGMGWLIGTPTSVMEKFGATGKRVADRLRVAVDQKEHLDGVFENKMESWGQLIKGKETTERVAKALDGDVDAQRSLSGPQKEAYDDMKAWFEDYAEQLGIPKEGRIKDYLPHMFDNGLDEIEQTLAYLKAGKKDGKGLTPEQIAQMDGSLSKIDPSTLAYLSTKSNYVADNGFLKERKGKKDYTLDLEKILIAYNNAATNTIAYKPAIDEIDILAKPLLVEQKNFINATIKALNGETDTVIEKSIDGGLQNLSLLTGKNLGGDGTTSRLSKKTRSAIYNATIGANIGSAVRNTQGMVNVFTEVGLQSVIEGAPRAIASLKKGSPMREVLQRNGVLSNRQGTYLQDGIGASFQNKGTKVLWGMFNTTETLNRATAFFAGYDKHLAKFPDDIAGAEKAGAYIARKTSFKFSAIDIPLAMQGDMAKNVLQMQTYNIQQTQFIGKMIGEADPRKIFTKGKDGKYSMNMEPQLKLARFIGGNAAFFATVGAATGMDWKEAVPFADNFTNSEAPRSPITQIVFGDGKANPGLVGTVQEGFGAITTGKWGDAAESADAFARASFRTLAPGGNQIVKSIEGAESTMSGLSTTGSGLVGGTMQKAMNLVTGQDPTGNIRFTQGQDAWSRLKATVLGQYATESGRDWVDEGMKNVPTSLEIGGLPANDYIKMLPRAEQEQYVSYYANKSAAQETLKKGAGSPTAFRSEIIGDLKSGKISQTDAIRKANEYNQKSIDLMRDYLKGNKNIPARLKDDLISSMQINAASTIESSKKTKSAEQILEEYQYLQEDTGNQ